MKLVDFRGKRFMASRGFEKCLKNSSHVQFRRVCTRIKGQTHGSAPMD